MGSIGNVTGLEYLQQANDALLTIVQIETKEALANVWIPCYPQSQIDRADNHRSRKSPRSLVSTSCSLVRGI